MTLKEDDCKIQGTTFMPSWCSMDYGILKSTNILYVQARLGNLMQLEGIQDSLRYAEVRYLEAP